MRLGWAEGFHLRSLSTLYTEPGGDLENFLKRSLDKYPQFKKHITFASLYAQETS